jgi:hypothetical protein
VERIVFRPGVLRALVLALTVMIAGCGGQREAAPEGPERASAEASLPASFALLQTPGGKPPPSVEAGIAASFASERRPRVTGSYAMGTPLGKAWMLAVEVPGGGRETCLVMERSGLSSCSPDAAARRIGLAIGLSAAAGSASSHGRRFTVMGVVPDRIRSVVVRPLDGQSEVLRVTANAFSDRGPAPILIKKYCRGFGSACESPR